MPNDIAEVLCFSVSLACQTNAASHLLKLLDFFLNIDKPITADYDIVTYSFRGQRSFLQ